MKSGNPVNSTQPAPKKLFIFMLLGMFIGLALISIFVYGVDQPPAEWGSNWRLKPLIITPIAGAMGGLIVFFIQYIFPKHSLLAGILGIIAFVITLWLGTILGLNGTMWN